MDLEEEQSEKKKMAKLTKITILSCIPFLSKRPQPARRKSACPLRKMPCVASRSIMQALTNDFGDAPLSFVSAEHARTDAHYLLCPDTEVSHAIL
jgi:hypothetical protein